MKEEKYSRESFDDYRLRVKVEIHSYDLGRAITLDIYTTETNREAIDTKLARSVSKGRGYYIGAIHYATKEQDDNATKMIEEWLSNE